MIAAPKHGFVFLAMSKCASTSIESAFTRYAQVTSGGIPAYKHLRYRQFDRYVRPLLDSRGHTRDTYEVVCLFRHPVEWVESWYRYRSRPSLNRNGTPHPNYAGDLSFTEFVELFMAHEQPAKLRRPARFVEDEDGEIAVDRIYRLEDLDQLVAYLNEKVGKSVVPPELNVSPPRETTLSDTMRSRLESFMSDEMDIYLNHTIGH